MTNFPQGGTPNRLETALSHFESALARCLVLGEGCPTRLTQAMEYCLLAPGKRLRPRLVFSSAICCGSHWEEAVPAACAVEMVHTYSLIHDDLPAMDDDDLRRGRPSCHIAFGEGLAILAGDALLTLAFEVLARATWPPEVTRACVLELARAAGAEGMVGGQTDDLAASQERLSLPQLESIHARKTGALIRCSVRLGGLVAGASGADLARLSDYGEHLGIAFQAVDDLLDETASESDLGKRIRKDLGRGKRTFPQLLGLEPTRDWIRNRIDRAVQVLHPWGDRADDLRELARFVGDRTH